MTERGKTASEVLTREVLNSLADIENGRMRELVQGAVRAAHDYARKVNLKTDELIAATEFMTSVGQMSDQVRKEFILLSDATALTMVVDYLSHQPSDFGLETSALGPFYRPDSPLLETDAILGRLFLDGAPLYVTFQVTDTRNQPVPGAELDIWLASDAGLYENQDENQPDYNLRGRFIADKKGEVSFWTIKPGSYPIPHDGPVGKLLELAGRHPYRPGHIHLIASAESYTPVISALFIAGDQHLESDAVYAVKDSLIVACKPSNRAIPGGVARTGVVWEMTKQVILDRKHKTTRHA